MNRPFPLIPYPNDSDLMKHHLPKFFILPIVLGLCQPAGAAFVWLGQSNGFNLSSSPLGGDGVSLYAENNWDDDSIGGLQAPANNTINNSAQSPAGVTSALRIDNGFVAGGANGAGSNTAHLRSNGNAIQVSNGSGLKLAVSVLSGGTTAVAAWIENVGTTGGTRSSLSIDGGFVTTGALKDISATLSGAGSRMFFISHNDNGLSGNNSLIELAGGLWSASPVLHWASMNEASLLVSGVLESITVAGAAAVWGADPFVYEPGDNVLVAAADYIRTGTPELPQNNWYGTTRGGYNLIAVPEPGSAVLALLGCSLLARRRRVC
jgi:hypothetical protein